MLRKLLAADVERVEGIRAIGAVLEEILLRFGLLLHRFVFAEAVATTLHAGRGPSVTYPASVYQNRVSRKKVSIIPVSKNGWCLPFQLIERKSVY